MDSLKELVRKMKTESYKTVDKMLKALDKINFINISYPEYATVKITVENDTSDEAVTILEKIRDELLIPNSPLGTCYIIDRRTD